MDDHPTLDQLRQWHDGQLSEELSEAIEAHLESCELVCQPVVDRISKRDALFGAMSRTPETEGVTASAPQGYEILDELGRGAMGVVYKARQVNLNRLVALKMILSRVHSDPELINRFRAEAEIIARLRHPNIVQIY